MSLWEQEFIKWFWRELSGRCEAARFMDLLDEECKFFLVLIFLGDSLLKHGWSLWPVPHALVEDLMMNVQLNTLNILQMLWTPITEHRVQWRG